MFFLDEKIMAAVPGISLWINGNISMDNEFVIETYENNGERKISTNVQNEIDRWKKYFSVDDMKLKEGFICSDFRFRMEKGNKSIEGISNTFSKIKNKEQLIQFAFTYGNLGLVMKQEDIQRFEIINRLEPSIYLNVWNACANVKPGFSDFEPLELWWFHIEKVRKILKLYRALLRINRGESAEIEDTILRIGDETYHNRQLAYEVLWSDGTPTLVYISEEESSNFLKIGRLVLRKSIVHYVSKGIEIDGSETIETEKNNLGFYVLEKKTTEYLITAIYYDLWQLINANIVVEICQNPKCQLPILKVKRKQYCDDACKQEAYRIRKGNSGNNL